MLWVGELDRPGTGPHQRPREVVGPGDGLLPPPSQAALAAAKLLETGELEDRLAALEAAVGVRRGPPAETAFGDEAA